MNKKRIMVLNFIQTNGAIIFFCALVIFNCFFTRNFMRKQTFWNLAIQSFPTLMLGFGSTLVISTGHINIALGSMMSLAAVLFAMMIPSGCDFFVALLVCILISIIPSLISGVLIAKFKFPAMIVTMAFMYILRGISSVSCGGFAVTYKVPWIQNLTMIKVGGYVPLQFIVVLVIFAILYFFVQRTSLGIRMQATGVNAVASEISGINVRWVVMVGFIICTALAAFAGVEQAMMVSIGDPSLGSTNTFDGICAAVIGGTPMGGGRANLVGTLFAGLFLQLISIMCNMNGVHYAYAYIIKAGLIFIACAVQVLGQKDN
ncbi:MAG: ABC transporter permease [Clostridia bacterium]|nr:ABC transporter permease [Clostridia bacterium]